MKSQTDAGHLFTKRQYYVYSVFLFLHPVDATGVLKFIFFENTVNVYHTSLFGVLYFVLCCYSVNKFLMMHCQNVMGMCEP